MRYQGATGEYLEVLNIDETNASELQKARENELTMLWFDEDDTEMIIDAKEYKFYKNQIICLTQFHKLKVKKVKPLRLLRFNKPFYCILDHDDEVGCKGILFYGSAHLPILNPDDGELEILESVWKMLLLEMKSRDNLQQEMLQMMLKRILILNTRIYKRNGGYRVLALDQDDIVREFNFLVETHFREYHTVGNYAKLMNKSPKTLANIFGKLDIKTPLQFIQDRIMLEARRLIVYSNDAISEIAYDLGYNDIQSFSRFFKKQQGISPNLYRKTLEEGTIAN